MVRITQSTIRPTLPGTSQTLPTKQSANRWALAAALLAVVFGAGFQAFGQGTCTNLCLKQVSCTGTATTSISGTVYTPNGVDPLPNVVVYVPNAAVEAFKPGVACVTSAQPVSGTPLVGTTTSATTPGTYILTNMPVGNNIPVVIQAGRWRRQYTVNTTACTNTVLNMSFPKNQSQGDIPLIAVVTGSADAAECVLRKVGIDNTEFTVPTASGGAGRIQLYKGSAKPGTGQDVNGVALPSETTLVGTSVGTSALNNYDMTMFACQGIGSNPAAIASAQTNVINYANAGGRIFATHYSYVWLYNDPPFSTTAKWKVNQSKYNDGSATINTSFAGGQQLAQWLYDIGASKTYGKIDNLTSPKNDQTGIIAPTQSWLTLDYNSGSNPNPVMQLTFDTPVGAASSAQCGRVLFNEYHVETPVGGTSGGQFPSECDTSAMNANEKLLEYSLFDLSTFIVSQTPPTITATLSNSPTDFFQGDAADTFTVSVTNTSTTSPANPSLSFTVALPAGVTATSMQDASGTGGWLCTASTLTCTRVNGLDANSSDNVILTVSVSPTAPAGTATASVTVTGGGLTADVSASDSFRIYGVPLLTWPAPAAIIYGAALSNTQLDATVANNLPGGFTYTPPAGTVLDAGIYTLSTVFTATDTVNYPKSATASVSLTVNQVAQTITFATLASPVTYGSVSTITLSATGGASGSPVTFTVTGPATLTGNTLTITGAGTVTVTANQAGSTNYAAATPVTQTIVVNPAAQKITFATLASPVTYGSVSTITLSATGGASGNPVTFKVLSGPATVSGNTLTITGAGLITVAADQAGNTNYAAAAEVSQTVTVSKLTPVINLTSTPTTVFILNPITMTAVVPALPFPTSCTTCALPTGTVTFMANGVPLGTAPLSDRTAVLTTSLAAIGTKTITAVYNGDSNFSTQTSASTTIIAVDFTLTATGTTSQNIEHGTTTSYSFVMTPVGSATIPSDIKMSLSGFPQYSVVTFTPETMAAGSGATSITLTIQVPSFPTGPVDAHNMPTGVLPLVALGALLLPFGRRLRLGGKRVGRVLLVMLLLVGAGAMAGLSGCGSGWNHEDFTPHVAASAGALTHEADISLRVH